MINKFKNYGISGNMGQSGMMGQPLSNVFDYFLPPISGYFEKTKLFFLRKGTDAYDIIHKNMDSEVYINFLKYKNKKK